MLRREQKTHTSCVSVFNWSGRLAEHEAVEGVVRELAWTGVSVSKQDYLSYTAEFSAQPQPDAASGLKQLVYLTSDAEETLETLDPRCAYVIGGIVDRNRLKGATCNKASAQGIRTAKLPIKENFALSSTHL